MYFVALIAAPSERETKSTLEVRNVAIRRADRAIATKCTLRAWVSSQRRDRAGRLLRNPRYGAGNVARAGATGASATKPTPEPAALNAAVRP